MFFGIGNTRRPRANCNTSFGRAARVLRVPLAPEPSAF
jgi:hypothetical protein